MHRRWYAVATALVLAATAWGMFIRARRQLLLTRRERALRAETDQRLNADRAGMAERTRISREMHDVLAHRISLMALHAGALEVRPDLPAEKVRDRRAAALDGSPGARGVAWRDRSAPRSTRTGGDAGSSATDPVGHPSPGRGNPAGGAKIDFKMQVDDPNVVPSGLGRDAFRILQEALTNIGKHGRGTGVNVHQGVPAREPLPGAGQTVPVA